MHAGLGPIDGTLGSCSGIEQCSSSYDDRPSSFVAPWQYDGSQAAAVRQLVSALVSVEATVQQQTTDYIYATAPGTGGTVDLEFLFAPNDNTVALRASVQIDKTDAQQLPLQAAFSKLLGGNDTKKLLETGRPGMQTLLDASLYKWSLVTDLHFQQRRPLGGRDRPRGQVWMIVPVGLVLLVDGTLSALGLWARDLAFTICATMTAHPSCLHLLGYPLVAAATTM
eukprot:gene8941-9118_t